MSIFPDALISIISKVSPVLGTALGGPAGGLVGSLISGALGVDMAKPDEVVRVLQDPEVVSKIKAIELQFTDLQNARLSAEKDTGPLRYQRIFLAILAMLAIFADVILINYSTDLVVKEILLIMLVSLVWDVRNIYSFYFGKGEEVPSFLLKNRR